MRAATHRVIGWLSGRSRAGMPSGQERRASERDRRVVLSGAASMATKIVTIGVMLVTVPLSVRYLGGERYGLWMAVTSVVTVLGFADLGVGNGLVSALAAANGRGDEALAARLVASAYFLGLATAVVLAGGFALVHPLVDWGSLFNATSEQARAEAPAAVAVLVGCFVAGLPFGVVQRVQSGLQEAYLTNLWLAGGSLLGLAGIVLSIWLGASLPAFVAASAGGPVVALAGASSIEFFRRRPHLRPRLSNVDKQAIRSLLGTGALFIAIQVAVTVMNAADNFIVARVLGVAAVTELSIASRLFMVAPMLLGMFFGPLWPAYGEAQARGDHAWIRQTFRRSLAAASLVGVTTAFAALVLGRWLVAVWVGPEVVPSLALLAALAAWSVIGSYGGATAMLLNGLRVIRFQAAGAVAMTVVGLAAKIYLANRVGLPGVPAANVVANLLCITGPGIFAIRRALGDLERARPGPGQPAGGPTTEAMSTAAGPSGGSSRT